MTFISKAIRLITGKSEQKSTKPTKRQLIEMESKIGGRLFGPIPDGHHRDFFCLDGNTWVWHEEWRDLDNKLQTSTIRYEVQDGGILKVMPGRVYKYIDGEELSNFLMAVRLYYEQSMREIYGKDPHTGQPLYQTPPATIYS
jgi:hypothetical protein